MTKKAVAHKTPNATIAIQWDKDQCALIVNALAEQPFKAVFTLIGKLSKQVHKQFPPQTKVGVKKTFRLTKSDIRCCLEALRKAPSMPAKNLVLELHAQLQSATLGTNSNV